MGNDQHESQAKICITSILLKSNISVNQLYFSFLYLRITSAMQDAGAAHPLQFSEKNVHILFFFVDICLDIRLS